MTYTKASLVKAYVGATGTSDDALIDTLIVAAKGYIDDYTNRTFDGTSTSARAFTVGKDTEGRTLFFDEDVAFISSIVNKADSDSGTEAVTSADYVTIPRNKTPWYAIKLKASANKEWSFEDDPESGITVTASWRYGTSAPAAIQEASRRLTVFLYRQKDTSADLDRPLLTGDGVTIMPSMVPVDVRKILDVYRKRHVR
jgi:hypothetical protein